MDIGCGHGLLGIAAIKSGCNYCLFQDYNEEVINKITKPNNQINGIPENLCGYQSGDWALLNNI